MKILVTSLPDLKRINPQRPHHLLKHLSEKHDITVLSVNAWWLDKKNDEYIEELFENINFIYISNKKTNTIFQELFSYKVFNENKLDLSDFDVHINFNSLILGYYVTKNLEIPSIFDICDDIPERIRLSGQIPGFLSNFGVLIGKIMLNKLISKSNNITCVSTFLCENYKIPSEKSSVLPNGVDTQLFKKYYHRSNLKFENDDFIVGFSGFLSKWVDLSTIFSCLRDFDKSLKIKLLIVGGGDKLNYFKNLAKKCGLEKDVIFTGSVNYNDVPKYISMMDVCITGYRISQDTQNSHPLKLFEYMACEKPIIATPLNIIKELVGNKVLYAYNKEDMVKAIMKLYNNYELRVKMGKEGRDFVKKYYKWEKISEKFENILLEEIK